MRLYPFFLLTFFTLTACREPLPPLAGEESAPRKDWSFLGDRYPCLLEVKREVRPVIRVNCFAIDGVLYIHSNRFVEIINLFGESWVATVARDNRVRLQVDGSIYLLLIMPVDNDKNRETILRARGYDPIPDGIRVFRLLDQAPIDETLGHREAEAGAQRQNPGE